MAERPDPVTDYARAVIAGDIVAGRYVRLACQRHLRDLAGQSDNGLVWDLDRVDHVLGFFGVLRLADGEHAGLPFVLQPWQQFIVGCLFGWLRDGYRRFRTAYVEVGKGNGKTPMAAALGLYMTIADGEEGAECYSAAVGRDQAGITFRDAVRFREESAALRKATRKHVSNISYPPLGSFFRAVHCRYRRFRVWRPVGAVSGMRAASAAARRLDARE